MKKGLKEKTGFLVSQMVAAKRQGVEFHKPRKDLSITTRPEVPVPHLPEYEILEACKTWLTQNGCGVKRLNNGAGDLGNGFRTYGIVGAGDLQVILPDGRHCEVECKNGWGGKLSWNQQKHRDYVQRYNGLYLVVHGVAELEHKLRPYLKSSWTPLEGE